MDNKLIGNEKSLLIYKNEEGNIIIDAIFKDETWNYKKYIKLNFTANSTKSLLPTSRHIMVSKC